MRRYSIIVAVRQSDAPDATLAGHEFLMLRTRKRPGRLELPGGTIEPGEEPDAGARRELLEETGHDWEHPVLVQRRDSDLGEGFVFLCRLGRRLQEPEASTEGLEFHRRLPARERLSFPDDPYDELFASARAHLARPARPRVASDRP